MPKAVKSDIEKLDPEQEERNLLHTALLNGDTEKVKTYLELGTDPTIKDGKLARGCVAWGARGGSLTCLLILKEHMSERDWFQGLYDKDIYGNIALHLAAAHHDNVNLFEFLYYSGRISLIEKGQDGLGLYHIIFVLYHNYSLFNYINSKLSNFDRQTLFQLRSNNGFTAIAYHAANKNTDAVQALLSLPEANEPTKYLSLNNTTPLMVAASVGGIDTMQLLLNHKQMVNYKNLRSWTAIATALINEQQHAAKFLVEQGANVTLPFDDEGRTLLHWFIRNFPDNIFPVVFLLNNGAMASLYIEDIYGYRPFEWIETDLDTYLTQLSELDLPIRSQIKVSCRKKAQKLNFNTLSSILEKEASAITPYIKDGCCHGYSFLGALSYFNNHQSLNQFYADQKHLVDLTNQKDSTTLSQEVAQWANDCVWMQGTEIKKSVLRKTPENSFIVRNWHYFGQRERKEALKFVSDKLLYGPFKQITFYFKGNYEGDKWVATDLATAITRRLKENEFMDVCSWNHTSIILRNKTGYTLVEQNTDGEIKRSLTLNEVVNLLINYHYIYPHYWHPDKQFFDESDIFPFSLRCWSFEKIHQEDSYEAALRSELTPLLKDEKILAYTSPQGGGLLHFCAGIDDHITLKTLLVCLPKTNINQSIFNAGTPLEYAMNNYSKSCVEVLAENIELDVFCQDKAGKLVLLTAFYKEPEMFLLLMRCLETNKPAVYKKINSTAPFCFFGCPKENNDIEVFKNAKNFEELEVRRVIVIPSGWLQ